MCRRIHNQHTYVSVYVSAASLLFDGGQLSRTRIEKMAGLSQPMCLKDFEPFARKSFPEPVYKYYRSGSHPEQTLRDNEVAFQRYRLRPRVLRDVSHRDMRTTLLGQEIAFPVAVAPTAAHCFAHIEGELATARAAKATGTGMVLSSGTTSTMEDVAAASSPNGLLWVQLQIFRDFDIVRSIIRKAEKLGYRALVVTIDCSVPRRTSRRSLKLPPGKGLAHFPGVDMSSFGANITNDSVTWKDIDLLHSITSLPVVLKGILTEEDAREALKHDIAGIIVSNHGGRNLDGTLATIDALAEVVEAVRGSNIEVYLDGGVRRGTDVLKALALGARAVFIGRPVLWGLAYDGEGGVRKVLEMIRDEFSLAMALSGCRSVGDITPDLVVKQTSFSANL